MGQTTVRATTQSSSHCLSGEESRDKSCELRLLYRQQSNYLNQHGLLMHGCVALDSSTPQVSVEVKEALCIRHNFRNVKKRKQKKFSRASSVSAVYFGDGAITF